MAVFKGVLFCMIIIVTATIFNSRHCVQANEVIPPPPPVRGGGGETCTVVSYTQYLTFLGQTLSITMYQLVCVT